jgi:hypothetical protein
MVEGEGESMERREERGKRVVIPAFAGMTD